MHSINDLLRIIHAHNIILDVKRTFVSRAWETPCLTLIRNAAGTQFAVLDRRQISRFLYHYTNIRIGSIIKCIAKFITKYFQ